MRSLLEPKSHFTISCEEFPSLVSFGKKANKSIDLTYPTRIIELLANLILNAETTSNQVRTP